MNKSFWKDKKVFITGHTGFKGAWLTAALLELGAKVTGYSIELPTKPCLFEQLKLENKINHVIADINDRDRIRGELIKAKPDIVFHLAAQSLVRYSYKNPLETFDTNIIGTLNVLEAIRNCQSVKSAIIVTTDKCYLNNDSGKFFTEDDPLGGKDPYSASKAAAEIVTYSYIESFLREAGINAASVRAGNVIGGGDFSEDRLIPDVVRATENNEAVQIRNPKATRPWQFVLEPLSGYMLLAEKLVTDGDKFVGGWNFGPEKDDIQPVEEVLTLLKNHIPFELELDQTPQPAEAKLLALDIIKAKGKLGWKPQLNLEEAISWTGNWYKNYIDNEDIFNFTSNQIREFYGI